MEVESRVPETVDRSDAVDGTSVGTGGGGEEDVDFGGDRRWRRRTAAMEVESRVPEIVRMLSTAPRVAVVPDAIGWASGSSTRRQSTA